MNLDSETFEFLCSHMEEECRKRGVCGVFIVMDNWIDTFNARLILTGEYTDNGVSEAMISLAAMLEGDKAPPGGRYSEDGQFLYVFSGADYTVAAEILEQAKRFHKAIQ